MTFSKLVDAFYLRCLVRSNFSTFTRRIFESRNPSNDPTPFLPSFPFPTYRPVASSINSHRNDYLKVRVLDHRTYSARGVRARIPHFPKRHHVPFIYQSHTQSDTYTQTQKKIE